MSNCKRDDVGGMKLSFTEMQKTEIANNNSTFSFPAAFRAGHDYFIAIRGKTGTSKYQEDSTKSKSTSHQSCTIFGCWNDAQVHLKQMKMEGRNIVYDAFENIDDATQYAFGKNEGEVKEKDQTPDLNAIERISPFIGAYRKRQEELLQGSLLDVEI